jgi:hypothetical protein
MSESGENMTVRGELTIMNERIERLEEKLDRILALMERDCKKMRDHIDFVENVYDKVKAPFNYMMNSVNKLVYTRPIPILDNNDE